MKYQKLLRVMWSTFNQLEAKNLYVRYIIKTIAPRWSWDYRPRENSRPIISRLWGNSFYYFPNKRAVNICFIYQNNFESGNSKNYCPLKSASAVYNRAYYLRYVLDCTTISQSFFFYCLSVLEFGIWICWVLFTASDACNCKVKFYIPGGLIFSSGHITPGM